MSKFLKKNCMSHKIFIGFIFYSKEPKSTGIRHIIRERIVKLKNRINTSFAF